MQESQDGKMGRLCDGFTEHIWADRAMDRMNGAGRNEGIIFTRDSNLQHSRDVDSPHVCKEQSTASAP